MTETDTQVPSRRKAPPPLTKVEQQARNQEKRDKIIAFLASEGYTTTPVAADVMGVTPNRAGQTLRAFARDGLLVSEKVMVKGREIPIYGLAPLGAALSPDPGTKPHSRGRIDASRVMHRIDSQTIRAKGEGAGWTAWRSERDLLAQALADREAGAPWRKVPDAVAIRPDGRRMAIEIERNVKSPKRYADLIVAYLQEIKAGRYDGVYFLAPDRGIAEAIPRSMRRVAYLQVMGERVPMDGKYLARFKFYEYDQWPSGKEVNHG